MHLPRLPVRRPRPSWLRPSWIAAGSIGISGRRFDRERFAKIAAEQLAGVSRMALRAYDACQAGDEQDAKELFDRLNRMQF